MDNKSKEILLKQLFLGDYSITLKNNKEVTSHTIPFDIVFQSSNTSQFRLSVDSNIKDKPINKEDTDFWLTFYMIGIFVLAFLIFSALLLIFTLLRERKATMFRMGLVNENEYVG